MVKTKKTTLQPSKNITWINVLVLLALAVLILYAVAPWDAWRNVDPNYHGWNLYSYFTIQSNLIAAIAYIIAAIALMGQRAPGRWFSYLRGGAVLYMLVTGIVYVLLLQNNPEVHRVLGFSWKNFILHQAGPIFIITWWLLWPSRFQISARAAWWWLIFPAVWLIYTFVRASLTGWYPYPFLDPNLAGGTIGVTLYVSGIAAGFILLSQFVAWMSRARAKNVAIS
ncbi:MAG TPA: Pr6Pr family membrane protein [Candidatus Saccharimonadales bacterium]